MKESKIMKGLIFFVVLLIPVIYSFFYLKSYWNPYGDLSDIKIAVVNLDKTNADENQGKEFIKGLKESAPFEIDEISLEEANEGMKNGSYYAEIIVPDNFTECLKSSATTNKQIATITYSPNQASNYLATQIINSAIKTVETNLQGKINKEIVATLSQRLESVPDSLEKISNGAETILDGSKTLNTGIKQISEGTEKLCSNYNEFDKGINSAYEGSSALNNGAKQVNSGISTLSNGTESLETAIKQINSGIEELSKKGQNGIIELTDGITELNTGAKTLNEGIKQYVAGTDTLSKGTKEYVTGVENYTQNVDNYVDNVNKLLNIVAQSDDPTLKAQANALINGGTSIKGGGKQLNASNSKLTGGANQLLKSGTTIEQGVNSLYMGTQKLAKGASGLTGITDGITSLKNALAKVQQGTKTLQGGVLKLGAGAKQLEQGTTNLNSGLKTLDSSSTKIKSALSELNTGAKSAYNGGAQLVQGIETFSNEIDKGINETNNELKVLEGMENIAENPVDFKTEAYGEVDSYGIAFTPLFLSIGLWVGALMCYVVLYYDQKNRFKILGSSATNKLLQNAIYILIGAIEGIITGAMLKAGLGYDVQNVILYYFTSMLIGITFMSIIQFLIRNFGDIGKLLALIILVLQLAASGGTFPIETIDKSFRAINPLLPMTYTIKLLKEILVPTATNYKGLYIGILIGITIVTLGITYIVDIIKSKKK